MSEEYPISRITPAELKAAQEAHPEVVGYPVIWSVDTVSGGFWFGCWPAPHTHVTIRLVSISDSGLQAFWQHCDASHPDPA
jgi:hypothetical protein